MHINPFNADTSYPKQNVEAHDYTGTDAFTSWKIRLHFLTDNSSYDCLIVILLFSCLSVALIIPVLLLKVGIFRILSNLCCPMLI
mmetsp:Transcript_13914/g.37170  ORF Transcript_13914/g.37170 Transcript_13914/m.37170 type:complete len:85 (-) Transcript_13914:278-532(-)